MYRLNPPVQGFHKFDLFRSVGSNEVTLQLFADENGRGGDTYTMSQEEVAVWLVKVGCQRSSKVVDLCWNFPHIHYDLKAQQFSCPDDDRVDPVQSEVDGMLEATLGPTVPFAFTDYIGPFDGPFHTGGFFPHG